MPVFDPTNLGPQGRVFDGSNVTCELNGVAAPKNCLKGLTGLAETVEGKEYATALGEDRPFAQTVGVATPGETTLLVFSSHLDAFLKAWDPTGNYRRTPVDITITLDERSSPGLAAIASALKLGTKTYTLTGCEYSGMGATFDVGGSVLVTEIKVKPLRVELPF